MRIILVAYIYPSRLEVSVSAQAGFATVQAGFATVSGLGRCPGRFCHGVSGLGRCPGLWLGLGLTVAVAVAVGRRKHNFTQLNRIKIHNFNYDQCGAP